MASTTIDVEVGGVLTEYNSTTSGTGLLAGVTDPDATVKALDAGWFTPSQANQNPNDGYFLPGTTTRNDLFLISHIIIIRKDQTVNGTYYPGVTLWGTDYSDGEKEKQVLGFGSAAPTNGYHWVGAGTMVLNDVELTDANGVNGRFSSHGHGHPDESTGATP